MLRAALEKRNPKNTEQYSMKEISVLFFMAIFMDFFLTSHQMLLFKMYRNAPKHLKKKIQDIIFITIVISFIIMAMKCILYIRYMSTFGAYCTAGEIDWAIKL